MKRFFHFIALSLVSLMCAGLSWAAPAGGVDKTGWPDQLRFMSGPPGGNWFALGTALADIWSKEVVTTSSSSGGGVSNIINADSKKGDLGFSVTSFLGAAMKREEDFKDRTINNAVIMANLYTQVTYFIIRDDYAKANNIKSLGDLLKKDKVRFATLKPGTASEFAVKVILNKGYNLSTDALKKTKGWTVEYASYEGGADLIADKHIDVFAFSVGPIASIVMNIESNQAIQVLPIEQAALDKVAAAYGTVTHEIKPGIYKSVTTPVKTLGDYTCIVVSKDLPESLVYELNKSMWNSKKTLAAAIADMQELSPKTVLPQGLPSHPGSQKFWQSVADKP
ncbi:MAG: TAXI family TRAP transporter solute-binding subunit [Burkholderiales bacterium]|jgi:TRAP transporter TAXI family solute receptor|nr:TAXI family TRAP transporter solute-binding subunit [Burkholderiales bacterium]